MTDNAPVTETPTAQSDDSTGAPEARSSPAAPARPSFGDEIDAVIAGKPTPASAAPEDNNTPASEAQPKPAETKPPATVDDELNAGLPKRQQPAKPGDPKPNEPTGRVPQALRDELTRREQRIKELEAKLTGVTTKPDEHIPEFKTLRERQAEIEKRNQELEESIRFVDYQKSKEFKTQYKEPLDKAVESAVQELASIKLETEDRTGTANDFQALLRMDTKTAAARARELFGDAAPEILAHRRNVLGLVAKRNQAIEEFRTKGAEREQAQVKEFEETTLRLNGIFDDHLKSRFEGDPEIYGEPKDDPEAAKLFQDGRSLVELAFRPKTQIPAEKMARVQAEVAARAVGYGRALHQLAKQQATIQELKAKLEQYEHSEPPLMGGHELPGKKMPTFDEEIDRVAFGQR